MPAVAVVTLIGVGLLVAVLAAYLIRVAFLLRHVVRKLNTILGAVGAVNDVSAPIGEVATAINSDLDAGRRALEGALARLSNQNGGQAGGGVEVPS